jgi:hypothetical protein
MPIRTFQRLLCGEPAGRLDDREPGAGRALGVILMRLGVAEIDQHAIAHILGDKAAKAADGVGDTAMVGADDLAQVLGIKAGRQRRRTNQIAEHHRQLPPLRLGGGVRRGRSRHRTLAESSNRRQQPSPIADRSDADVLQVVCRQLGQHVPIDRVFVEGRRVFLEA